MSNSTVYAEKLTNVSHMTCNMSQMSCNIVFSPWVLKYIYSLDTFSPNVKFSKNFMFFTIVEKKIPDALVWPLFIENGHFWPFFVT